MFDIAAVRKELIDEMTQIQFEIDKLWEKFQKEPKYFGNRRSFTYAHYGYMMILLARVDLLPRYWKGKGGKGFQTTRMVDFLDHYVHPGSPDANKVAVQLWRHTLMHTGEARFLKDTRTGENYTWQLAFGPRSGWNHYTLWRHRHDQKMVLTLIVTEFAADLQRGQALYLNDLEVDPALQTMFLNEDPTIREQPFTL